MGRFDEKMRQVERSLAKLTGSRSKALAFRKCLEAKVRQAAAEAEPTVIQSHIKSGKLGWVNDPDGNDAVLVERGTGCVLKDTGGRLIRGPKVSLPPALPLDKGAFLEHLRTPGIEGYAPYMYLDSQGFITVGIGLLLRSAEEAKGLAFFVRGTNERAHARHIENAFNKVASAPRGLRASEYKPLTNIEITEAEATLKAVDAIDDFLRQLTHSDFYPEFETYPETAKTGLLDMAYVLGPTGTRDTYKNFTSAVRHRNWRLAAIESDRPQVSRQRNAVVRQWFEDAARQEHFFVNPACRPKRIELRMQ